MRITFLSTGAAEGIPAIGCECAHCLRARREGGKLQRERNALLVELPSYTLLVEVPPDIRTLIDQAGITHLDGLLATRARYDHIGGLVEFEYWPERLDFLAEERLFESIRQEIWTPRLDSIIFHLPYYPGAPLYFEKFIILPFAVRRREPIFGVLFQERESGVRVVYTNDTPNRLTNYARYLMREADLLITNTPTFEPPKEDHITVVEAIQLHQEVGSKRLILTDISHQNKPHDELEEYVSQYPGVEVAYDGMVIEV